MAARPIAKFAVVGTSRGGLSKVLPLAGQCFLREIMLVFTWLCRFVLHLLHRICSNRRAVRALLLPSRQLLPALQMRLPCARHR